jgi:hypothetical protein
MGFGILWGWTTQQRLRLAPDFATRPEFERSVGLDAFAGRINSFDESVILPAG